MVDVLLFLLGGWVDSVAGGVHFGFALVALILGPLIFRRRKGDARHRILGYVFVLSMLVVDISALVLYDLTGYPNLFHFFALWSLAALLPGFYFIQRAVRTGERRYLYLHAKLMVWAYFGVAGAGVAQGFTRFIFPLSSDPMLAGIALGLTMGVSGALTSRWLRKQGDDLIKGYRLARGYQTMIEAGS